jgi:hypothetical protein
MNGYTSMVPSTRTRLILYGHLSHISLPQLVQLWLKCNQVQDTLSIPDPCFQPYMSDTLDWTSHFVLA